MEDQLFYNPMIRISLLSAVKANLTSNLVFRLLKEDRTQMIIAGCIFGLFSIVPLWYARVLSKNSKELEADISVRKFGSLYDNKNVNSERDHQIWFFPIAFFYRRTAFVAITIFLFDRPDMQMISH